jgi:hypothetical protein
MSYRGTGGDLQGQISLDNSTRKLVVKWSTAPATDTTQTANNSIVPFTKWTHFAVVKKTNGGNFDLLFYINGALTDTITSVAPTGGTIASPTWYLGWGGTASNGHLNCYVSGFHFSNAARTQKEIQHVYSRACIQTKSFTQDANTLVAWRMDDSPTTTAVADTLDTPTHLDVVGSVKPGFTYGLLSPAGGSILNTFAWGGDGGGRDFSVSGGDGYFENTTAGAAATALKAEWTAFILFKPITATPTRDQVLLDYAAAADHPLIRVLIEYNGGSPRYKWQWEGAAVQSGVIANYTYKTSKYLCLTVKKSINGGNYDVKSFINGILVATATAIPNATNGTNSYWSVGRQAGTGSTNLISGELDEIFITKQALSDAAIKTAAYAALGLYDGLTGNDPFGLGVAQTPRLYVTSGIYKDPSQMAIYTGKLSSNPSGGPTTGGNRRGLNIGLE